MKNSDSFNNYSSPELIGKIQNKKKYYVYYSMLVFTIGSLIDELVRHQFPEAMIQNVPLFTIIYFLILWVRHDSKEYNYYYGIYFESNLLFLSFITFPYYLIASRGWKRGLQSIGKAFIYILLTLILSGIFRAIFHAILY